MAIPNVAATVATGEKVLEFVELRKATRDFVGKLEQLEDDVLGKRHPQEFFPTDASFEPPKNQVVKVSSVIAALNLMAANFMIRTWPEYLKTRMRELIVGRIAGVFTAATVTTIIGKMSAKIGKMSAKKLATALAGPIGALAGAAAVKLTQEKEMRALEIDLRKASVKVRRSFQSLALSQRKKPARVGPTYTRHP